MRILVRKVHWISFEMSCETLESSINQSSVSTFTSVEHLFSKVPNFILQTRSIHFVVHYAFVRRHLVRYQLALQDGAHTCDRKTIIRKLRNRFCCLSLENNAKNDIKNGKRMTKRCVCGAIISVDYGWVACNNTQHKEKNRNCNYWKWEKNHLKLKFEDFFICVKNRLML